MLTVGKTQSFLILLLENVEYPKWRKKNRKRENFNVFLIEIELIDIDPMMRTVEENSFQDSSECVFVFILHQNFTTNEVGYNECIL